MIPAGVLLYRDDTGRTQAEKLAQRVRGFRTRPALGTFLVMFAILNVAYSLLRRWVRRHPCDGLGDVGRLPVAVPRGEGLRPAGLLREGGAARSVLPRHLGGLAVRPVGAAGGERAGGRWPLRAEEGLTARGRITMAEHVRLGSRPGCSSTARSSTARRGRSRTSTRPPRRCSARSPTPRRRTCAAPSTPPGEPSTRPTGRRTARFRKHCLEQLQEALESEREELREQLILEVGLPPDGHPRARSSTPRSPAP